MKTNQLIGVFTQLVGTGRMIRYGQLLQKGFHSAHINNAVNAIGAKMELDADGYTIIKF